MNTPTQAQATLYQILFYLGAIPAGILIGELLGRFIEWHERNQNQNQNQSQSH